MFRRFRSLEELISNLNEAGIPINDRSEFHLKRRDDIETEPIIIINAKFLEDYKENEDVDMAEDDGNYYLVKRYFLNELKQSSIKGFNNWLRRVPKKDILKFPKKRKEEGYKSYF